MADRTSVTEDDLRSILVSHAATADHRSGRLEEVHRRVSGLRRRRATSVAGLALAVVTVIVVMSLPAGHRPTTAVAPRPTVAPTAGSADLLPAYLRGGRLVAFTDQRTPTAAYLTFVPTSLAFGVVDGCSWANAPGGQSTPAARVTINGRTYEGSGCGVDGPLGLGGAGDMGRPSVDFANHYGIRVGRPVMIRFGWDAGTVRPGSRFRIGVYQGVPVDQYPFPPRPAELLAVSLADFRFTLRGPTLLAVRGSSADPNQSVARTVTLTGALVIDGTAVEPGQVSVLVNGRQVFQSRTWDYSSQGFNPRSTSPRSD